MFCDFRTPVFEMDGTDIGAWFVEINLVDSFRFKSMLFTSTAVVVLNL